MVFIKDSAPEIPEMFWGIRLDDGKRYTQTVESAFHISMAAIDTSSSNTEPTTVMISHNKVEYVLCTLQKGTIYQQHVDFNFAEGESLTLFTKGKGPVYLTGYRVFEQDLEDDDDLAEAVKQYRGEHSHDGLGEFLDDEGDDSDDEETSEEEETSDDEEEVEAVKPVQVDAKKRKIDGSGDAPVSKKAAIQKVEEIDLEEESDEDSEDEEGDFDEDEDEEDSEDLEDEDDEEEDDEEDYSDEESIDEAEILKLIEKTKQKKEQKSTGSPQVNGKTPDTRSAAKQEQKTPKAEQKSPKKEQKTPKAEQKSPIKEQKTPKAEQKKSPIKEQKTPKQEQKTPTKQGQKTPNKAEVTKAKQSTEKQVQPKTPDTQKKPQTPKSAKSKSAEGQKKGGDSPKSNGQQPSKTPKKVKLAGDVMCIEKMEGHGPVAKSGRMVHVYYIGKLQNGKQFDATTNGPPFKFRLGKQEVIKGWDVGLDGMKVGGKRTLTIPPAMAYGNQSIPGIPRNSTLVFDVELRAVS